MSTYRPFLIIILIGFGLLALSRLNVVSGLRSFVSTFTKPVLASETATTRRTVGFVGLIAGIRNLAKENTTLRTKNIELEAQLAKLKEVNHENEILRKELNFVQETKEDYLPTAVIGRTPTGIIKDLILDRGKNDLVEVGASVIAQGHLIGIIATADDRQSTVRLLTDPRSLIPVVLQDSRSTGILKGGISGLIITDLLIDATIKEHEAVLTSGLGGHIPAGIPIGTVTSVTARKGDITKKATVTTPHDVTKLEVVFVRRD